MLVLEPERTHYRVGCAKGNAEALLAMKDQFQLKIRL